MAIHWQKIKETIEWLYHLLRPRTHNRIALIVVLAGVGILASPFWEPYLRAILEQLFAVKIEPPTSPWFGFGLIVAALLYHYGAMRIEHSESARDAETRRLRNEKIVLIKDVRKRAEDFVQAGKLLLTFVAYKFFVYPKSQTATPCRFAMQPSLNVDRDGDGSLEQDRKYDLLTNELDDLVEKMSESYDELINSFHVEFLI